VAQYASDNGNGKTASNSVDQCLRYITSLLKFVVIFKHFVYTLDCICRLACLNTEMASRSCLPKKSNHLRWYCRGDTHF
jgi:hypothetical protein